MPTKLLKDFLDSHHVKYMCITHSPGFTAQEVAAVAHISGKQMAKTVIVKMDEQLAMIVLPAHDHVNFSALKKITGAKEIDLARESDFKSAFPECEVGAMPPFGNLYGMPVFVSNAFSHDKIVFNSGTHTELVQMTYEDFLTLVKPKIITLH
ncbi:MAG: YbaK/EbsC family protein [Gammaproteobacteria bacterium]|nr:YbaK/EbsC family protein [Gammaproteobacteria bacterium]